MHIAKCSHKLCNKKTRVYECKYCKKLFCRQYIHAKIAHSRYGGHTCLSYRHHLSTIRNNAPLVASENIEKPVFQTTHKLEIPTWVKVIVIVGILIYAYQAGWLSQIATKATDFLETIEVPVGVQKIIEGTPLS